MEATEGLRGIVLELQGSGMIPPSGGTPANGTRSTKIGSNVQVDITRKLTRYL